MFLSTELSVGLCHDLVFQLSQTSFSCLFYCLPAALSSPFQKKYLITVCTQISSYPKKYSNIFCLLFLYISSELHHRFDRLVTVGVFRDDSRVLRSLHGPSQQHATTQQHHPPKIPPPLPLQNHGQQRRGKNSYLPPVHRFCLLNVTHRLVTVDRFV